jgi:molybdate transport system substrate-binding protein
MRAAALLLATTLATPALAEDVVVFAAASLKTALDPIAADFQTATGHRVTISYAGSNALAQQIIQGAPADIFLSAATNWMDEVERNALTTARKDLLGNTLILIAHGKDAAPVKITPQLDLPALLNGGKLSMAMVDAVPAGQYGKEALTTLGLWDAVAPSVAQSENVRAALALVAQGEAPLGIVYATDAAAQDNVSVLGTFPAESHTPITYPAALLTNAQDDADRAFFDYLSTPEAAARFTAQGFTVLP